MKKRFCAVLIIQLLFYTGILAQTDSTLYVKDAIKATREKIHSNIVNNSITKNLSTPLTDTTEENWQDAFYALELINYRSPWVDARIQLAFDSVEKRSTDFQRALLELAYSNYKGRFTRAAALLLQKTQDPRIFAMAAEYYLASDKDQNAWNKIVQHFSKRHDKDKGIAVYYGLFTGLISGYSEIKNQGIFIRNLTSAVPGEVLLISFQRKNRDYPGIALIRDASGNFVRDKVGKIFGVPQLARSTNNLPFYLTNGNTPQGFFKMNGFDVSRSMAIGPTTNIQLIMPFETSPQQFFKDPSLTENTWTEELYKKLLPESLQDYLPLYESFYAGKAGRTEIIAHGTTVNPEYYKNRPYYPLTPTQGCLCTKEIWSMVDGRRMESDQQKLVNALKKAGAANGYCIVVEIDDQQKPVSLNDILPFIK